MSHKTQIKDYLKGRDWTMGADIKRYFINQYITDADRRCREMVNEGELESKIVNGKVYYRTKYCSMLKKILDIRQVQNIDTTNNLKLF